MQQKIEDLETRLSFQEDNIEQMNRTLLEQHSEMHELREMMKHLQKQIVAMAPSEVDASMNETPPHY